MEHVELLRLERPVTLLTPILLACPDARIYALDDGGVQEATYEDVDAVRVMKGFSTRRSASSPQRSKASRADARND